MLTAALDDVTKEETKSERKLYKGELTSVAKLVNDFAGSVPIQPIENRLKLPPSFIVTRFQPNGYGGYLMHYYHPQTGQRSYREVPLDLELNVLTGIRGEELRTQWNEIRRNKLGELGRRLTCTLGTDPEVFVVDAQGEIIPAWTYLPGKDVPKRFRLNNRDGEAYWDGFQAEFTTGGNNCLLWVSDSIQAGLKTIHDAAATVGGKLTIDTVLPVNPDILQNEAVEHVQFGCAPSYNAYGLRGNIEDGRNVPYRFAGGHLHLGITNLTKHPEHREKAIQKYVKALDLVLGVASVSLLGELDNPIRRRFYGQPGEYRMPAHGFEYRTLSNAWLCHPLAMNMVFDLARSVCGLADEAMLEPWQGSEAEAIEIIMNNDIAKAREVLDRNKDMFRGICRVITGWHYTEPQHLDLAFKVWRNGIDSVVANPKDIVGNWNLDGDTKWILHGDGRGKNWEKAYDMLAAGQKV